MECIFIYHPFSSVCCVYTREVYQPGLIPLLSLHDVRGQWKKKTAGALLKDSLIMSKGQSTAGYCLSFIVSCPLGLVKTSIGYNWAWIFKLGESR